MRVFRRWEGAGSADNLTETEKSLEPGSEGAIRCGVCGASITYSKERIDINGAFEHGFTNPAGYMYHIACYKSAPGCSNAGQYETDFTWFPGFSWRYALCGSCHIHLGWHYSQPAGKNFFGLIRDRLHYP
jgi:hypothetical protein